MSWESDEVHESSDLVNLSPGLPVGLVLGLLQKNFVLLVVAAYSNTITLFK